MGRSGVWLPGRELKFMALHPDFPKSPYAALFADKRWFSATEELRRTACERLLPPLVAKIRTEILVWRQSAYAGASETSRALLSWWFGTEHLVEGADDNRRPGIHSFTRRRRCRLIAAQRLISLSAR